LSKVNTSIAKKITSSISKLIGFSFLLISIISITLVFSLRWLNPQSSHFISLYEESSGRSIQTKWVHFEDIPWHMAASVIASEDQRFPKHKGFRGASTLSQQTIKNLFLWPEKSFLRKTVEGWFTVWLEILVPKKRILEIYLNIAQFSQTTFGVENASRQYFGKSISVITEEQSRHLAICLPAPARCRPNNPSEHSQKKAEWIKISISKLGGKRMIDRL